MAADAFDNTPPLIRTATTALPGARFSRSSVSYGDRIYLATDALASWFLRTYEQCGLPWQELDSLTDIVQFEAFLLLNVIAADFAMTT